MKTVWAFALVCLTSEPISAQELVAKDAKTFHGLIRLASMCFKSSEEISGMNKICYYDCPIIQGSKATITIKAYELCPLTIDR
jgi:hypothetical protein